MPQITLYIATSIDGFIARKDGDVSWLEEFPSPSGTDYGYQDFLDTIGTVVMGNETYKFIQQFDIPWPYPGKKSYVLTRDSSLEDNEDVSFLSDGIPEFFKELRLKAGQDIWLIGGGKINQLFLDHGLIDLMIITMMPIVLGDGIPLFATGSPEAKWKLKQSTAYDSGAVGLVYDAL